MSSEHTIVDIVFCASSDPTTRSDLERDLLELSEGAFTIQTVATGGELTMGITSAIDSGAMIPLVFVDEFLSDSTGLATLTALSEQPDLESARRVLISDSTPAVAQPLDGVLRVPWSKTQLKSLVSRLVTEYFIEEAPQDVDEVSEVVDVDVLSKAFVEVEERAQEVTERLGRLQRSFLDDRALSDDDVEAEMIAEIDRALGNPPRTTVPSGTRVLSAGDPVDGIRVVVDGRVHLTLDTDDRTLGFHARTAGRVIGLNAIALSETKAFFNVDAIEDTTFIALTLEQLDDALRQSPTLAIHLVTVLLRAMARRNRRSIELRMIVDNLARDLERERDELAATIDRLNQTQARLIESEKLATLGQLAAGVGHELNNPAAVVSRTADFLAEDIEALTAGTTGGEVFTSALRAARQREPVSTRVQRQRRNELAKVLGDPALARRLVKIGIESEAEYQQLLGDSPDPEDRLDRMERFHRIGTSLRSVDAASQRIVKLVGSVRSYVRGGDMRVESFDLRQGIEETLLLLGHELGHVKVEKTYHPDVPAMSGQPGELNQVWTNLITNAIQAMDEDNARLTIEVGPTDDAEVRVAVTDNGQGISPENLERVFEPAFTTKAGRVEFGLGLGLQIVKDIVVRHNGSISVESKPGMTCFTVVLPAASNGETQ
ncbi:MAG: cyclic nucleotide-binding domain-containing protein [bacterium]|nr:cyclic nucleotide-binding domain-containing protein [bacterium]